MYCNPTFAVTKIINASLTSGEIPTDMKVAAVCPVYKKGDPTVPGNYRPVSLLPIGLQDIRKDSTSTTAAAH